MASAVEGDLTRPGARPATPSPQWSTCSESPCAPQPTPAPRTKICAQALDTLGKPKSLNTPTTYRSSVFARQIAAPEPRIGLMRHI